MQKILKWLGIIIGGIILIIIVIIIAVPLLIPSDAVKDFATKQLSKTLNRTVSVEAVSFNIFEGFQLKGISISNRKGFSERPFVKADSINLSYAFWPIFRGKLLVHEISLIKPEILIEKNTRGATNYDDMISPKKPAKAKAEKKDVNIELLVNTFSIKNARFSYHDYLTGMNELKNFNLRISGITLALLKPIEVEMSAIASYLKKDIPVSIKSRINVDKSLDAFNIPLLAVKIAGESFSCPINAKNLKAGPEINFSLSSKNLSLDRLVGIFATQSQPKPAAKKPGALTKSIKTSVSSIPQTLKVKGSIDIKNTVFQKLKLETFKADVSMSGRKIWFKLKDISGYKGQLAVSGNVNLNRLSYSINPLNLKGFVAARLIDDFIDSFMPALLNLKNKAEGTLDVFVSLSGQGVEMPAAFKNLKLNGVAVLANGRLKNIKTLNDIGDKFSINILKQDILVKGLRIEAAMANRIMNIKNLDLTDTDFKLAFKGGLDFNTMKYQSGNRLTLKLSPEASKEMPKEFSVFRDEKGFLNVDFELQGSLMKPIPAPRLDKPVERAVGKLKVEIEAKKVELEQQAKEQASKEAEKLKKEAEKKIKEILKF